MSTINKVFRKLAESENKIELRSHRIQLNILQNAEDALKAIQKAKSNSYKRVDKIDKNGIKYAEQINKIINNYLDEINAVEDVLINESDVQEGAAALKRIEQTAKDLGLKAAEVPIYKKLSKELDGAQDLVKDIKSFIGRKYGEFKYKIKL